ncbi:MAG: DUF2207 domain-containing protein, partial [Clostridia bacterium]|nr:DUF2207 domain-containing protein [Clostridia bacterium]
MTKKYSKILIIVFLVILAAAIALFASLVFPRTEVAYADIKNDNVIYESVEKRIVIDERKSCDITEIITVTYKRAGINVGLSRNVSRVNKITRIVDGKTYVNTTRNYLTLFSVTMDGEDEFNFVEEDGDYYYINTGADGDYKSGTHVYEIHYQYDMGEDFINDFDDFTFDIMDYGFRSAVGSFSAEITLPKDFLDGKFVQDVLTFRTNKMAPLGFEAVSAEFDAETLTVSCSVGRLNAREGLTIQLILPQGYFETSFVPHPLYYVTLALTVIAVIAVAAIVITSRVVRSGVVTTEFYPPEGYSPLNTARAYRGNIRDKDFASLVIYWASKGLVSIELKGRRRIVLTRLNNYPAEMVTENSKYEVEFFNRLFAYSDTYDTKESKYASSSEKRKLYEAVKKLYKPEPEQFKTLLIKRLIISLASIIPFILCAVYCNLYISEPVLLFILLFPIIAVNVFLYVPMPLLFKLIWCGGFGGIPLGMVWTTFTCVYDIYSLLPVTSAFFLLGTLSCAFVRAFSKEDKAVRGKVLGFKKFLVLAELDKLNALIEDDPDYFYDILPYCYVFGITKKMEKKFAALRVDLPDYFNGATMSSV